MNNVIPIELLIDTMDDIPYQYHLNSEIFYPQFFIEEEYLCSVCVSYKWISPQGTLCGSTTSVDHPSFAELRNILEAQGLLKVVRNWWNGDSVIRPFFFNKVFFDKGDRFPCASAMIPHLNSKRKYHASKS